MQGGNALVRIKLGLLIFTIYAIFSEYLGDFDTWNMDKKRKIKEWKTIWHHLYFHGKRCPKDTSHKPFK